MLFETDRVRAVPSPPEPPDDELGVLFVGHAPGAVRWSRISDAQRRALVELGLAKVVNALPSNDDPPTDEDARARSLLAHLPLPVRSISELTQVFPDAARTVTRFRSRLGGARAWLQWSLEDFFQAGGRLAWVVVVDEALGAAPFLPRSGLAMRVAPPEQLMGVELVALLADAALVCCPDLERLAVPPELEDHADAAPPVLETLPRFVPFAGEPEPPPATPPPTPRAPAAPTYAATVLAIAQYLEAVRPDVQWLAAQPLAFVDRAGAPALDQEQVLAASTLDEQLRARVQPVFPYLRSPRYAMCSPVGGVAGSIARFVRSRGAWRSIAGLALRIDATPLPGLTSLQTSRFREQLGLGVLEMREGALRLDDERCTSRRHRNSAEAVRFLGWLRRQLTRLAESLVFVLDPDDVRPGLALSRFFHGLYQRGALDGAQPEQAFVITRLPLSSDAGEVGYQVELAPAYAIDAIVLTFVHARDRWRLEVDLG